MSSPWYVCPAGARIQASRSARGLTRLAPAELAAAVAAEKAAVAAEKAAAAASWEAGAAARHVQWKAREEAQKAEKARLARPSLFRPTFARAKEVKARLKAGASFEECDDECLTYLAYVSKVGLVPEARAAIAAGADVNSSGEDGGSETPLFCALDGEDGVNRDVVVLLVKAGADTEGALEHALGLHFHPDCFAHLPDEINDMSAEELRKMHESIEDLEYFLRETLGDKREKARVAEARKRSAEELAADRAEWEQGFRDEHDAAVRRADKKRATAAAAKEASKRPKKRSRKA